MFIRAGSAPAPKQHRQYGRRGAMRLHKPETNKMMRRDLRRWRAGHRLAKTRWARLAQRLEDELEYSTEDFRHIIEAFYNYGWRKPDGTWHHGVSRLARKDDR